MQILVHAGAHPTDEDKLYASLDANTPFMAKKNIVLPRIQLYRRPLRQAMIQVAKNQSAHRLRENLLNSFLQNSPSGHDTMILSLPMFFGSPKECVNKDRLFPDAVTHLTRFCTIFNQDEIEIFFAIRNPATFLPACMQVTQTTQLHDILRGSNYMALRWSELFVRLRTAFPQIPITTWCDEDTPFIWAKLLREFMSATNSQPVSNAYAIFAQILTREGFERFKGYMQNHPDMNPIQRRKVMYAFAEKFARPDAVIQDLNDTPWDQPTVDRMTENYDADVDFISNMAGVTLIEP